MKYLIWANLKMNKTMAELNDYLNIFASKYSWNDNIDVIIAPVTASLSWISEKFKNIPAQLSAQNMHYENSWAYTWETSPLILKELWCGYVIIGHSERRSIFGETDELINKKLIAALANNIRPIFCIGETIEQKQAGISIEVLKSQFDKWLKDITAWERIDIAYEPVWAIGTWLTATPDYIWEIHNFIRDYIKNNESRIIYGWSVKETNALELISVPNVDGFLIWWAALDATSFVGIIDKVASK